MSARKTRARSRPVEPMGPRELMAEADIARRSAYAPYSKFKVGAALLTASGKVFHGCNVENASYSLTICAERNAVFKAVSEGEDTFVAIAVSAGPGKSASPCGSCRQVLHEFAPDLVVHWREPGRIETRLIEELLASPFSFRRPAARRGGSR